MATNPLCLSKHASVNNGLMFGRITIYSQGSVVLDLIFICLDFGFVWFVYRNWVLKALLFILFFNRNKKRLWIYEWIYRYTFWCVYGCTWANMHTEPEIIVRASYSGDILLIVTQKVYACSLWNNRNSTGSPVAPHQLKSLESSRRDFWTPAGFNPILYR